jgi:hypothetical protein
VHTTPVSPSARTMRSNNAGENPSSSCARGAGRSVAHRSLLLSSAPFGGTGRGGGSAFETMLASGALGAVLPGDREQANGTATQITSTTRLRYDKLFPLRRSRPPRSYQNVAHAGKRARCGCGCRALRVPPDRLSDVDRVLVTLWACGATQRDGAT